MKRIYNAAMIALIVAGTAHYAEGQTVTKSAKVGDGVYELVYNTKSKSVYVATTRGKSEQPVIYQLDRENLSVKDSIVLETGVFGLGINQKTQTLYGTATRDGGVIAIDISAKKAVATIANGLEHGHTRESVVDEKNNKIYVSDVQTGVWEIDGKTNKFVKMLPGIPDATGLTVDADNSRLYAISKNRVVFYDLKTTAVIDSFATEAEGAINLALDTKRNHLFVSHQKSGNVTVLDTKDGSVVSTIPAGEGALGISYSPKSDKVFVANRGAGTVTIIDASNFSVLSNSAVGSLPNTVVVDTEGNAYVSSKAKGVGRPKQGEKPKVSDDPQGDIVSKVSL